MKAIKCELCGSSDFKKINGEYECQFCHTKYTVEEAKKLMIDGVVEVKGTVNVDSSSKQKNYEKLAERSFKDELYDQAYDYYNKLLELDSDNWKYVYKKGICAAWQSTLANFRIDETIKACKNAFNIISALSVFNLVAVLISFLGIFISIYVVIKVLSLRRMVLSSGRI